MSRLLSVVLVLAILMVGLEGCASRAQKVRLVDLPDPLNLPSSNDVRRLSGEISEVAPPAVLLDLAELMDRYEPQVTIASPKAGQTLKANQVDVKLKLKGLPIYKDEKLNLGPHIQLILDNQPARSVYSLDDPILFEDLAPGSHTLRAIATQPWGESFKNESAYAQTTFHVLAETGENSPDPDLPLITYLSPQGEYSAEPVLLDFYLNNAPLHAIAQQNSASDITDWQIRCSVNGQSFVFDQWQPIYLKGLKPGQNWIQLSLIDDQGQPIKNAFNNTVHTFNYDPQNKDTLAKIVRGELPIEKIGQIAIRDYEPPIVSAPITPEPITPEPTVPADATPADEDRLPRLGNESETPELERKIESQATEAQDDTEAQDSKVRSPEPKAPASDVLEPQNIEVKDAASKDLTSGEVELENSDSDVLDQPVDDDEQSVENSQSDQRIEEDEASEESSASDTFEQINVESGDSLPSEGSTSEDSVTEEPTSEDSVSQDPNSEEPNADVKREENLPVDDSPKETLFNRFSQFIDALKGEKETTPAAVPPLLEDNTPEENALEENTFEAGTDLNTVEIPELTKTTESDADLLLKDVLTDEDNESNNELIEDKFTEEDKSTEDESSQDKEPTDKASTDKAPIDKAPTDEIIEALEAENAKSPNTDEPSDIDGNAVNKLEEEKEADLNNSSSAPQSLFSQLKDRAKSFIQQSSSSLSASTKQSETPLSDEVIEQTESSSLTPESNVEEIIPQAPMLDGSENLENETALPRTLSAPDEIPSQLIIPVDPEFSEPESSEPEFSELESEDAALMEPSL